MPSSSNTPSYGPSPTAMTQEELIQYLQKLASETLFLWEKAKRQEAEQAMHLSYRAEAKASHL